MLDKKQIWHDVLESIKVSVSSANFGTWFSQTYLLNLTKVKDRFSAEIGCSSSFIKSTIEGRYYGLIQDTLVKILETDCDIFFLVKENPEKKKGEETPVPLFAQNDTKEGLTEVFGKARLRPNSSFENFAVSSSNQMAHAAAEAVSRNPGNAYNPLFIWGGVGVGKTHLMNAVGVFLLREDAQNKVLLCTGEDFTNDIVEGIRNKTTQNFRQKYRKLSALLIDDIQFIAGKDAVQEEFFHTFNAVTGAGGQVILTSDKPPSEISKLEERLKSRFEAGLIVDIAPPDFELRCAILQIKAKERAHELPMELVQLIAANVDSARKIEGFLIKLSTRVNINDSEINAETIESILGKKEEDGRIVRSSPNDVVNMVAKYFSIGKRYLLGDSRTRPIARPRQILMYLLRKELGLPLEKVGEIVGGRDHTTVMHAVKKITHLASTDVQIREDLLGIKAKL